MTCDLWPEQVSDRSQVTFSPSCQQYRSVIKRWNILRNDRRLFHPGFDLFWPFSRSNFHLLFSQLSTCFHSIFSNFKPVFPTLQPIASQFIATAIYYLIPLFGLSGRLLSFDDVFGIAELEEIYLRRSCRLSWVHNLHDWWLGVGGRGRILSGGHRLVTRTVAGSGIDVAPPFAVFV